MECAPFCPTLTEITHGPLEFNRRSNLLLAVSRGRLHLHREHSVESRVELVAAANVYASCRDPKRSVLHYARPLSARL